MGQEVLINFQQQFQLQGNAQVCINMSYYFIIVVTNNSHELALQTSGEHFFWI